MAFYHIYSLMVCLSIHVFYPCVSYLFIYESNLLSLSFVYLVFLRSLTLLCNKWFDKILPHFSLTSSGGF